MYTSRQTARIAGALYLGVVATGTFSLGYIPSQVIDMANAATTLRNIQASEFLFRLGIVSSIICYLFFLLLPLVLYRLLRPVNSVAAQLMVILALISVPTSFGILLYKFTVLSLIQGHGYTGSDQLAEQVLFYIRQYNNGLLLVQTFWGLWLLPFGYLVYKSGFLPKVLGILLMLGCLGYLANLTGRILIPRFSELLIAGYITLPASIGEIATCGWLLIAGVNEKNLLNK